MDSWQKKLIMTGRDYKNNGDASDYFVDIDIIIGRTCPSNVYINDTHMVEPNRCVYYAEFPQQSIFGAGTCISNGAYTTPYSCFEDGGVWIGEWVDSSCQNNLACLGLGDRSLMGVSDSWYVGNIKTCADVGMRLPTLYETTAADPGFGTPVDAAPTFAGATGVPSNPGNYNWTASADTGALGYWRWLDTSVSAGNYNFDGGYVSCVLPGNDDPCARGVTTCGGPGDSCYDNAGAKACGVATTTLGSIVYVAAGGS